MLHILILARQLTLSHEKLFRCLYSYGIRRDLLRWIRNFFTGRTQQTKVRMALSELINLLSGVIQGSSIGPVMFLMYIDGLAKLLEHHGIIAKLFADDVKTVSYTHLTLPTKRIV